MDGPLGKHKLVGIGGASARLVMAAMAGNPSLAFLSVGLLGKFVAWFLTQFFSALASLGLVILNVGAERMATYFDGNNFDGSLDAAEKMIADIRAQGRDLTPAEIEKIDAPVIAAFRKWASFARRKS